MADTTIVGGEGRGRGAGGTGTPPAPAPPSGTFPSTAGTFLLAGMPVAQSTTAAKTSVFAEVRSLATAAVTGVATATVRSGEHVDIQFAGRLTLPQDAWVQVTGDAGGLVPGALYYVRDEKPGLSRQKSRGGLSTKVGIALSPVTLLVQIGEPTPIQ